MIAKLLTEHHLEFLSLIGSFIGSSESALVKMPHCCKSNAMAHLISDCPWHILLSMHCGWVNFYTPVTLTLHRNYPP